MVSDLFVKNRECIREFAKDQSLASSSFERLTIASEGAITTVFAPFDHTSVSARIAVVGITPGLVQAENALRAAGAALRDGKSDAEASRLAKLTASFSGTQTRNNLVNMLNAVGLASAFGVQSCEEMFDPAREFVHFTSALRYPVFINGKNYNGAPNMLRSPLLRLMIETYLAEEVAMLPNALWLPLGPKPALALHHLVKIGALPASRLLDGMPHPSGLNGERVAAFLGKIGLGEASVKTRPENLAAARETIRARVTEAFV
jgi:hypothetical protein